MIRTSNSYPYLIYHQISLVGVGTKATQSIQLPRGKNYILEKIITSWPETGVIPTNFSTPRIQVENFGSSWKKHHHEPTPLDLVSTPGIGGRSAQYLNAKSIDWPILYKGVFQVIITDFNPLVVADFIDLVVVGRAMVSG